MHYAVLTGDLVRSSELDPIMLHRRLEFLANGYRDLEESCPDLSFPRPMDTFRGDSWQLLVSPPSMAFRSTLYLRAKLAEVKSDTRVGIGIGTLPENHLDYSPAQGEAYILSGHALDRLQNTSRYMDCALPDGNPVLTGVFRSLCATLDVIVRSWTQKQAVAVRAALLGATQKEIAENWDPESGKAISQQAVYMHLRRANWDHLDFCLKQLESVDWGSL